jgi:outer membrane biosynthesis protein TonB
MGWLSGVGRIPSNRPRTSNRFGYSHNRVGKNHFLGVTRLGDFEGWRMKTRFPALIASSLFLATVAWASIESGAEPIRPLKKAPTCNETNLNKYRALEAMRNGGIPGARLNVQGGRGAPAPAPEPAPAPAPAPTPDPAPAPTPPPPPAPAPAPAPPPDPAPAPAPAPAPEPTPAPTPAPEPTPAPAPSPSPTPAPRPPVQIPRTPARPPINVGCPY